MKIKNALFLTLCFIIAVSIAHAQQTVSDKINAFMSEKYPATEPGASILVAKDGKIIFKKGYGLASIKPDVASNPDMIYRIGSITKQFTSTAILQLVEQGKIDLNADITKYLTGFTTPEKTVTVQHLLNHTSGIKSYTSVADVISKEKKGMFISVDEMVKVIQRQPSDFGPGEQYLYNNSGYFLLGAIIEKVSGMSYGEYVSKNLFKPAGMKSTFVEDPKLPGGITTGYQKGSTNEFVVSDYVHPSIPYSAGAIFSTVNDLWKWNQAVFKNKLVKNETLERAWTPTKLNSGKLISYGYGWQLGRIENMKVIGHGGAIDGFLSSEMFIPSQKIYVCILSNNMTVNPEEYVYQISEIVAGVERRNPTIISLDEQTANEYAGVYKINDQEERIITKKGNQFFSQRTGGTRYEIFPFAKDAFFFKDSPSRLLFIRSTEGKIGSVELSGREYVNQTATRTNKPIPSDRTEIELDPAVFDQYMGEYELAPGFIIKVWREENIFKAQATGQPFFEIFAESQNRFFLKVVDAQIEFSKDDTGAVSSMTLFQGGRQMLGKKIK